MSPVLDIAGARWRIKRAPPEAQLRTVLTIGYRRVLPAQPRKPWPEVRR